MKYSIDNEKVVFDDKYKMIKADVSYDTFKGGKITTSRLAFERGDSVSILLYEQDTEQLLFTRQFRYPTCKHNTGWLTEITAGSLEENETPEECIVREVNEELGYILQHPQHITTFYPSPGASTERMFLYYGEVSSQDKQNKGGGNQNEHEDIQLIKVPGKEAKSFISELKDAKSIVAIQWFLMRKGII